MAHNQAFDSESLVSCQLQVEDYMDIVLHFSNPIELYAQLEIAVGFAGGLKGMYVAYTHSRSYVLLDQVPFDESVYTA